MSYRALWIEKDEQGYRCSVRELQADALPPGDVEVRVLYSTLNYKDALAITGRSPVVRRFPLTPGIDLAGEVITSENARFKPGDRVILNGFGVGETHSGGLAQRARLNGDWLIGLPGSLDSKQAMSLGTAGYTAMLCVLALERHGLSPGSGEVLVTGAAGGVGSVAIALLAHRGWRVIASTGRTEEADYLRALGAAEIIDRKELSSAGKPLARERWIAAIDTVGSHTLANACAATRYGGVVAACGLAQGLDFPATVAPFILRGVTLAGIDSVMAPISTREHAWSRLAQDLDRAQLDRMTAEVGLDQAIPLADELLAGRVRGRVVVDVNR